MIVADSSYLVEAILRDARLIENQTIVAPDLTLYEVVNTLWKHQAIIGDLDDASSHMELFLQLVSAGVILLARPDKRLITEAYKLSLRHRAPMYDTIFVALALELGLELKTFDERQAAIASRERPK